MHASLHASQHQKATTSDNQASRRDLQDTSFAQPSRTLPRSSYTEVSVLLLKWTDDNLHVEDEVARLEGIFRDGFHFATEVWSLPSEEPEEALLLKLMAFKKGKRQGDLMILYYAGHGGGGPEECIWSATNASDSPWLNWHNVQGLLLGHPADVLLILDCCYASLAAGQHSIGDNWFLGSSVKEAVALGVSWRSFTSAMVRQLERAAHRFEDDGETYNVQSLSHDLNFRETDLLVTPNLLRLNRYHCEPTDLTPLVYSRERPRLASSWTAPVSGTAIREPRGSVLSQRHRSDRSTLPSSSAGKKHDGGSSAATRSLKAINLGAGDSQTVGIKGLPRKAKAGDIRLWLKNKLGARLDEIIIGPMVETASTMSTVATFRNVAMAKQALAIQDRRFPGTIDKYEMSILLDYEFHGLTTIYDSSELRGKQPDLDIVLVHDARGHPINSFATHYMDSDNSETTVEICWPRDELPQMLETRDVSPRIMTYGWSAQSWLDTKESYGRVVDDFTQCLNNVRPDSKRPLILLSHGLGGVLVKETVSNFINFGLGEEDFQNSVTLCVFFGVPHSGLKHDSDFASIVEALQSGEYPLKPEIGLRRWNGPLKNISGEFSQLRSMHGFGVLSFVEADDGTRHVVVPKRCASFDNATQSTIEIKSSHANLAKLREGDDTIQPALEKLSSIIWQKLGRTPDFRSDTDFKNKEDIYERLREYDTFFLIDDSESMEPRWSTTRQVLADIVSIAVKYDENGVDVKFFNKPIKEEDRTGLDTTSKVMQLFARNTPPKGGTLTADVLGKVLNEYMARYRENRNIKGLNLIVLTDGEPDQGQDVEGVLKKYAKKLEALDADDYQVGVQFVQIGGDEEATRFLKFLDDKLVAKHALDRDVRASTFLQA